MLTLDPIQTIVNVALGHTWVRETGANRGEAVEAILSRVGLAPGNPWCAAFVAYIGWLVFREKWPLAKVGGCASLADDAKKKGFLEAIPRAGSIFLLWGPDLGRFRHTGFIAGPVGTAPGWTTIEGNTSPDGSPEGTGVFVRERSFRAADRFIFWAKDFLL